jgi:phosphomannomutase
MTLMMSVSGVRGIVGETMTPMLAAQIGAAFGAYLGGGRVVLGRDTRPSGEMVKSGLVSGLLAVGCDVVDLGVVSTPGTALMISELGANGGVVITASHNPIAWNGIKLLSRQGFALTQGEVEKVYDRFGRKDFAFVGPLKIGHTLQDGSTHDRHVSRVLKIVDVAGIRGRKFRVVLDSVNGAGGMGGRMLLDALGCTVHHINAEPSGHFAHTPEPIAENLGGLCDAVKEHGANVGFAMDPDADRLAVVDDKGRYIGEEYTIALAAKFIFSQSPGPAAVNLSTSRMIDDLALAAGGGARVHRTAVGEANVASAVLEQRCVIGGEGNGGVIDPRVVLVRDSFTGMGLILNLLVSQNRALSAIVDEMPRYVMVKQKFEMPREKIDAWLQRVRGAASSGKLNDTDGLRIDWPEGWVHVRPSNTEPIARVISEAKDKNTAESLARRISDLMPR